MKRKAADVPWYIADFETTGENEYNTTGRTRVWLYAISDKNGDIISYGDNIEKFMEWCYNNHGSLIYFHNLRFDGVFIISYLLEHGFGHEERLLSHSKRGFSTLIGDMGEFYQIKINFASNRQVTIYDSLKLIPMSVREIARAFNLPVTKGEIDYDNYTINDVTLDYVFRDVKIVAMAMRYFRDNGYYRMTIGSNAYHSYYDNSPFAKTAFPRLDREWIKLWREAYRGGRTQVNPRYANTILNNVRRYDLNSMYPSIMAQKPLPYGPPIVCDKPGRFKFELYYVHIMFKLKEGHLPTLLKSSSIYNKAGDSYYIDSEGIIDLRISNLDLMIMKRHYDIYILKYIEILGFKCALNLFREWVNEHYKLKSESTGGMRLFYKLTLNSLYGKFGSRPTGKNKTPYLDEDGVIHLKLGEEHDMGVYYLPIAIAIVSWAHVMIDDAIMMTGYDNFVYCDTDSVHTLGDLDPSVVDQKELGKFKLEGIEDISKYIRQKTYIFKENGTWQITCAGMSYGIREYLIDKYGDDIINIFTIGLHVDKDSEGINPRQLKLLPKKVPGGVILVPSPFSLL